MANSAETKPFHHNLFTRLLGFINPETDTQRIERGREVLSLAHELLSLKHLISSEKIGKNGKYCQEDNTRVIYTTSTIFLNPKKNEFGINVITFDTPTDIDILDENFKKERLSGKYMYIYMFYEGGFNIHGNQIEAEAVNKDGFKKIMGRHDESTGGPQQRKAFYETFVPLAKQLLNK